MEFLLIFNIIIFFVPRRNKLTYVLLKSFEFKLKQTNKLKNLERFDCVELLEYFLIFILKSFEPHDS